MVRGERKKYEKDVKRNLPNPAPRDPRIVKVHGRLALLQDRILKRNLVGDPLDNRRKFIREDWEGADCQVYFNDPEEVDSQEGCENLFESEYEWLDEKRRTAAAKDVIISGPKSLVARNTDSDDSDDTMSLVTTQRRNYRTDCG